MTNVNLATKLLVFRSKKDVESRCQKLVQHCDLERQSVQLLNILDNQSCNQIGREGQKIIYLLGDIEESALPNNVSNNSVIIGRGVDIDLIHKKEFAQERNAMLAELKPGPNNVFQKHLFQSLRIIAGAKAPPVPSKEPRQEPELNLNDHVDKAISAVQFCKDKGIEVALPELDTWLSGEASKDAMTYDELLALLMVFKRLGAKNLVWRGKTAMPDED